MSWLGNKIAGLPISSRILEVEPQTRDLFTSTFIRKVATKFKILIQLRSCSFAELVIHAQLSS